MVHKFYDICLSLFGWKVNILCTNSTLCSDGEVDDVVAVDGDDGDDDQEDIAGAF